VWNEHEHGAAANPQRGYGEATDLGAICELPSSLYPQLEYRERPLTMAVTAEMPLEEEFGEEAEACYIPKTKLSQCPNGFERKVGRVVTGVRRRVASLPWKLELVRGTRRETEGVLMKVGLHEFGEAGDATTQNTVCFPKEKFVNPETLKEEERPAKYTGIPAGCVGLDAMVPEIPLEYVFYGTQEIFMVDGFTNGLHPSKLEFIEPGKLFSSEAVQGEGEILGELKLFGGEGQTLITAK
jgi:hypothetical protein